MEQMAGLLQTAVNDLLTKSRMSSGQQEKCTMSAKCPDCGAVTQQYGTLTACSICYPMRWAGVPHDYQTARLDDADPMRELLLSDDSLYLCGPVGRGKTYRAAAIMRHRIEQGVKRDRFVSLPELLLQIRSTYGAGEESESDVILRYATAPLLVLDDLGAEKTTDAVRASLGILIDRRATDSRRRTIITGNLTMQEIAGQHGPRIASRIAGMCRVISLTGPDRRL